MRQRTMSAEQVTAAANELAPFQQGQLDALCGIYGILNALQIASYPARRLGLPKVRSLFALAVTMIRKHHPHLNPATQGMANERMIWLAHHISKAASTKRMQFVTEACDGGDIGSWIAESLNMGAPVIACLIDWAHFSVIVNVAQDGFALFDSQGMSWLPIRQSDVPADFIDRAGTIRIRVNT